MSEVMKRPAADAAGAGQPPAKRQQGNLSVARRELSPADLMFGGVWFALGPPMNLEDQGQDEIDATVAAAIEAGIREFDTAPFYGSGSAEERLGRALVGRRAEAAGARVFTKVGRMFTEPDGRTPCGPGFDQPGRAPLGERVISNDYTAAGASRSLQHSLARMGLGSVHGLRIHDPNDNNCNDGSVDDVATCLADGGACSGLREMRENGLIQDVSIGMNCNREAHQGVPDQVLRLITQAPPRTFDSALLAGGWNLLSQAGQPCLLECERRGIQVHVAGVYASGLLAGGTRYAYQAAKPEMIEKRDKWHDLATRHGLPLPAVAIAFAALPRCVTRIVIGMANAKQVQETLAYVKQSGSVPRALWVEARELGLLAAEVPLPE